MRVKCIFCLFLIFTFIFVLPAFSNSDKDSDIWKKTLLIRLPYEFTDKQVKEIATEYGCSHGKIYRFTYGEKPHITVKFFIEKNDKSSVDVFFKMREDKRILSAVPDLKVQLKTSLSTIEEVSSAMYDVNKRIFDSLMWDDVTSYIEENKPKTNRETVVIMLDTGIAYGKYPWMEKLIYHKFGEVSGSNAIPEDYDLTDGRPIDAEDVDFYLRHGSIGAMLMGAMGVSSIIPIRVFPSRNEPGYFSDTLIGMEIVLQEIAFFEAFTNTEYNVIVNMSFDYSRQNASGFHYLISDWGKDFLFDYFVQEYSDEIKKAGYDPDKVVHEDLFKPGSAFDENSLLNLAEDWFFKSMYIDGTLTHNLKPSDGSVSPWNPLEKMKEKGWILLASAGNKGDPEELYPAGLDYVEAIQQVNLNESESSLSYPLSRGSWADLAVFGNFFAYNPDTNDFLEIDGSSLSTNVASAVYAKVWEVAPKLEAEEISFIIKNTAQEVKLEYKNDIYYKDLIVPYRAVRVTNIYNNIENISIDYWLHNIDLDEAKRRTYDALNDVKDEINFSDIINVDDLFVTYKFNGLTTFKLDSDILDILIEASKEVITYEMIKETFIFEEPEETLKSHDLSVEDILNLSLPEIPTF